MLLYVAAGKSWRSLRYVLAGLAMLAAVTGPARAGQSSLRTYDGEQGLGSLGGACMVQDRAGYILVCTEHGIYAYDGRHFVSLGPSQGLRQGGLVYGVALTGSGRIAIDFANEIYVSDRPSDSSHHPSSLSFRAVQHPGVTFYDERLHRLVAWRDGFVFLAGDVTERVVVPASGAPHAEKLGYTPAERALLRGASGVFSLNGELWNTFDDGRLCTATPGAVQCFNVPTGRAGGPWVDMAASSDNGVFARSATSVASFDAKARRWSVADLPDQGERYVNYQRYLGLFRAPGGELITQAEHGLAVLGPNGWRTVSLDDGAPLGTIVSAMSDLNEQLWFHVLGRGLVRWVGYGHWESFQKSDGLSEGFPWETIRLPNGLLYVSTDTAMDEIVRRGSSLQVSKVFPGASFAIAAGPEGTIWRSYGGDGVRILNPITGAQTLVSTPPVNVIFAGQNDTVWVGTQAGLFKVPHVPDKAPVPDLQQADRLQVADIIGDGADGVFYIGSGRLRHRKSDGSDVPLTGAWPSDGLQPLVLARAHDGAIWVGGDGGLCRFEISGDHLTSVRTIDPADTRTNGIVALTVDHRGWVWVGTALGVSVFDGQRWVSVDADGGLLSDDVQQNGLREDPDGSMWIATTQGLSHLIDPRWLFSDQPIKAVVSEALIGKRPVIDQTIPYTRDALSVQFGTPNDGAERSFVFRYNLSGVDDGWVESASGAVRYPFVPPGRHVLTVIGYDELTHRSSAPATLVVDVGYPWWSQWWVEVLAVGSLLALGYGAMRLRFRAILARQVELKRYVTEATVQLRYQAAHDSLTGLLNRSEIEARLAAKLAHGSADDEMIVALVDIDHFKLVNDSYGHLGGDDVLRTIGRMVSDVLDSDEYAGRYGGEEILLVLNDLDGSGARRVLNLHNDLRSNAFSAAGKTIQLTCSIGVAWARRGDDWESLIGRADDALYKAKASGRDRVVESGRISPPQRSITSERRLRPSAL